MDLKELRIGNLVWLHTDNTKYLLEVQLKDFEKIDSGSIIVSPIFLTKQWLLDAGFNFSKASKDGWVSYGKWRNNKIELIAHEEIKDMYFKNSVNIRHLHQLQNLYYAYTGSELNILP